MTPTPAAILNIAALGFALIILWRTEPALARMGETTIPAIRYALLLLAGSAIGIILTVFSGAIIDPITLLLLAGIALLLLCERRLRHLITRPGDRHA